ncbi:MAG TPA: hypothetical protein DGH68_06985 [Bacteroidetes bacterium]|nr:hypothetical protein [Bacteroidota bacterium]
MQDSGVKSSFVLGILICVGLALLGYIGGRSAIKIKEYERTVSVKGLAEAEYPADVVLWPIQFTAASNELTGIYSQLEEQIKKIEEFLRSNGIDPDEITISPPAITDKSAQQYESAVRAAFRYTAIQTVTVYSKKVEPVRKLINRLSELGKRGIVITGGDYRASTEYIFTRLNEVKPGMIQEATKKAREVAETFAEDSNSELGKIKSANQGTFTISDRDKNNPHIKIVRVVSTVEYYLAD